MLSVIIREKDGGERRLVFDKEEVTIGRSKGSDIMLPKNNISKRHSRLVDKDDKVVLVDLRSTNGTYVNGRRITAPEIISPDDKIYIGDFVLKVEVMGEGHVEVPAGGFESTEQYGADAIGDLGGEIDLDLHPATDSVGAEAAASAMADVDAASPRWATEKSEVRGGEDEVVDAHADASGLDDLWDEVMESTGTPDVGGVVSAIDEEPGAMTRPEAHAKAPAGADRILALHEPDVAEEEPSVPAAATPDSDDLAFAIEPEPPAEAPSRRTPEPAPEPVAAIEEDAWSIALEPEVPTPGPTTRPDREPAGREPAGREPAVREPAVREPETRVEEAPVPKAPKAAAPAKKAAAGAAALGVDGLYELLTDDTVEQVLVNSADRVAVVRDGRPEVLPRGFTDQDTLEAASAQLLAELGYDVDEAPPVLDAILPSGVSVGIVQKPLAPEGPVITLRRPRTAGTTLADMVANGAVEKSAAKALADAVRARRNVVVCGLPGSGRTTVASALAALVPENERIVVVEEAREMALPHGNVVVLDKGALADFDEDLVDLVPQLLPERVVFDPVSPSDVGPFVALALGLAPGFLATATSDGCHALLRRFALQLELAVGGRLEDRARAMIAEAVHVVALVERDGERGGAPRVTEVVLVRGAGPDGFDTMELLAKA